MKTIAPTPPEVTPENGPESEGEFPTPIPRARKLTRKKPKPSQRGGAERVSGDTTPAFVGPRSGGEPLCEGTLGVWTRVSADASPAPEGDTGARGSRVRGGASKRAAKRPMAERQLDWVRAWEAWEARRG